MAVTSAPEPGSPTPPAAGAGSRPGSGRRRAWVAGAVVVAALAFLLLQGLGDATVYFKTVDEAVAERSELEGRRFRIEGTVVPGSVRPSGGDGRFRIRGEGGATVEVAHEGAPPELFQPDLPVVLEGAWEGNRYDSDRIMVRHTSEYQARHPDRVDRYVGQGRAGDEGGRPGR